MSPIPVDAFVVSAFIFSLHISVFSAISVYGVWWVIFCIVSAAQQLSKYLQEKATLKLYENSHFKKCIHIHISNSVKYIIAYLITLSKQLICWYEYIICSPQVDSFATGLLWQVVPMPSFSNNWVVLLVWSR